ncbi:hypothetical protein HYV81_02215 [Candidatus Woesearchaeota archaeon]|nr:hypothetical protein [Candidatus Woesearchaeota archaeon]
MDVKLLRDIKETEEKARQIIAAAEKKRAEAIEKAKLDAMKGYENFLRDLEQHKEQQLAEKRAELKRKKKAIIAASEKGIEQLRQAGAANLDKAVQLVIEKFKSAV